MLSIKAKKRLRLLVIVGLAALVTLGGVYAARKFQIRRTYARYRAEGMQAVASGKFEAALEPLGKYVGRNPGDVEALIAYANARRAIPLPKGAHLAQTAQALRVVLRVDPNRIDQKRELLKLYADSGLAAEALEVAGDLLSSDPDDTEALRQRSLALIASRRLDDAATATKAWIAKDPRNIEAHLVMMGVIGTTRGAGAEVQYAESLKAADVGEVTVQIARGIAKLEDGKVDEAARIIRDAAAAKPTDKIAVFALSDALDRLGDNEASIALLNAASAAGDTEIHQRWLRRLWQNGNMSAYVEAATADAGKISDLEQAVLKVAALRRLRRAENADALVKEIQAQKPEQVGAWAMIADLLGGTALTEATALRLRELCFVTLGDDPANPFAMYALAEANSALGEHDQALRQFAELSVRNPGWIAPLVRVAEVQLARGRVDEALAAASAAVARTPKNVAVAGVLARVWDRCITAGRRSDVPQLLALVEQVQQAVPGEEQTLDAYVRRLAETGRKEQAKTVLAAALSSDRATPSEFALLVWGRTSAALGLGLETRCIERSQELHGISPASAFFQAYLAYTAGHAEQGLNDLIRATPPPSDQNSAEADWLLARARYLDLMQSPEASRRWNEISERFAGNPLVQQAVLGSYSASRDRELQRLAIARLGTVGGERTQAWRLASARYLIGGPFQAADARKASMLLEELLKTSPDSMEARFLLARCLESLDNMPRAIEQMFAASRLDPQSRPVSLYLVQLLQKAGDYTRAQEVLNQIAAQTFPEPEEARRAAILFAQQGDARQAAEILQSIQSRPPDADLMLAQLLYHSNQMDRAQAISEKLLASPNADIILLNAQMYAAMGRSSDVERTIGQIDKISGTADEIAMTRAAILAKLGRLPQAIAELRKLTATSPGYTEGWKWLVVNLLVQGQFDEAMAAVNEGADRNPGAAELQSIKRNKTLFQEAWARGLMPLTVGLAQVPDDPAMLDCARTLCEPDADRPTRAIVYLSQLADRYPKSLAVQAVIVSRYLAFGRAQEAAMRASRMVSAFPFSPEPAKLATRAYAELAEWESAIAMAKLWRQRATNNATEADLAQSEIRTRQNQHAAAAEILKPYLQLATSEPQRAATPVAQYALCMYRAGRAGEADAALAPLLTPGGAIFDAWALAASSDLPPPQAAAWIERLSKADTAGASAAPLATAYCALAMRSGSKETRAAAIERLIALSAKADSASDPLQIGVQLESLGDIAAAEKLYRIVPPERDPQAIARNNLAMITAQRGSLDEALVLAKATVATVPTQGYAFDTLAFVQRKMNDYPAAAESLRHAMRCEPWSAKWRITLAEVLVEAGKFEDARTEIATLSEYIPDPNQLPDDLRRRLQTLRSNLLHAGGTESAISTR
jgi:tetratricopeptide (TPR) repeat protein